MANVVPKVIVQATGAAAQLLTADTNIHTGIGVLGDSSTDAATLSGAVDILADWSSAGTNIVKSLKVWKVGI